MLNDGRSDHPRSAGGSESDGEGFRPSRRQIIGAVIAVVLLVFIFSNSQDAQVSFLTLDATLPLWLVLALTVLASFGVGMMFGSRRTKRKLGQD